MRTILSVLLVSALAAAPFAAAQDTDTAVLTPYNGVWAGDEPNVKNLVCVPANDPSRCAVDDPNAVYAKAGTPTKVLQAYWVENYEGVEGALGDGRAMQTFSGKKFLLGAGNFHAWYGTWADVNGDGFIDLPADSDGDPDVVVNADVANDRSCSNDPGQLQTSGDGQDVSVDDSNDADDDPDALVNPGSELDTGLAHRCDQENEFTGIAGKVVVMYVTPGNFNDWVNGPLGLEGLGTVTPSSAQPDYTLNDASDPRDTQGASDGAYAGPSAGFPQVWTDNGLLQTTITETIAEPDFTPNGARAYNAGDLSVTDADLYTSVDPAVESLYGATLGGVWYSPTVAGLNPDGGWAPLAQKSAVVAALPPQVGGATASFVPQAAQDFPEGKSIVDYTAQFGLYMNVYLHESTGFCPCVLLAGDAPSQQVSADGDGKANTAGYFGFYGHIGAWKDKNGDGWIGTAASPDPWQGGARQDPNNYFTATSGGEFFETTALNHDAEKYFYFTVTMTSSTGTWGSGMYVLSDEQYVERRTVTSDGDVIKEENYDPDNNYRKASNQYSFNPWDDLVLDGASDGKVDKLVMSGPVPVHMVATTYSGTPYYTSYEKFVLPGGNRGFDILTETEPVSVQFEGLALSGVLVDKDVHPAAAKLV